MRVEKAWLAVLGLGLASFVGLYLAGYLTPPPPATLLEPDEVAPGLARATFGAGCFWCTEAVFQQLHGVHSVVSGYSGGWVKNPTYQQVCTGTTGHAEVAQVTYDPAMISYEELLDVFWQTHDPTTPNRQGHDVGPHYRSVIFYHTAEQKELAERSRRQIDAAGRFPRPIVTEIAPFTGLYRAEPYHQDYFAQNPAQPYCRIVIRPKVDKVKQVFADKRKQPASR